MEAMEDGQRMDQVIALHSHSINLLSIGEKARHGATCLRIPPKHGNETTEVFVYEVKKGDVVMDAENVDYDSGDTRCREHGYTKFSEELRMPGMPRVSVMFREEFISHLASPSTTINRQRPSTPGTGMPSIRWPHHSTTLHSCHGCQPYHLSISGGSVTTGIRPH
jgi:hypothetical protein